MQEDGCKLNFVVPGTKCLRYLLQVGYQICKKLIEVYCKNNWFPQMTILSYWKYITVSTESIILLYKWVYVKHKDFTIYSSLFHFLLFCIFQGIVCQDILRAHFLNRIVLYLVVCTCFRKIICYLAMTITCTSVCGKTLFVFNTMCLKINVYMSIMTFLTFLLTLNFSV